MAFLLDTQKIISGWTRRKKQMKLGDAAAALGVELTHAHNAGASLTLSLTSSVETRRKGESTDSSFSSQRRKRRLRDAPRLPTPHDRLHRNFGGRDPRKHASRERGVNYCSPPRAFAFLPPSCSLPSHLRRRSSSFLPLPLAAAASQHPPPLLRALSSSAKTAMFGPFFVLIAAVSERREKGGGRTGSIPTRVYEHEKEGERKEERGIIDGCSDA